MKLFKTGLTVMRAQPFHAGHEMIVRRMLDECDTAIVILGSAQESGTAKNPFDVATRMEFIRRVFGAECRAGRVIVGALADLGNPTAWAKYVLDAVWANWRVVPDAYYCGGEVDGPRFAAAGLNLCNIDRRVIAISATAIRDALRAGDVSALSFIHPNNRATVMALNQKQH